MSLSINPADRGGPAVHLSTAPAAVRVPEAASERPVQSPKPSAPAMDAERMRKELQEAVQRLNENMQKLGRNLSFTLDEKANRTVITVKNSQTGEVVRQIPDETVLKVAHSIEDFKGLLHHQST